MRTPKEIASTIVGYTKDFTDRLDEYSDQLAIEGFLNSPEFTDIVRVIATEAYWASNDGVTVLHPWLEDLKKELKK